MLGKSSTLCFFYPEHSMPTMAAEVFAVIDANNDLDKHPFKGTLA